MTSHHLLGQTKLPANVAHLVLEQLAQRLDKSKFHIRLQAAHIVVCLDGSRRSALRAHRLDHVRIERALHQEFSTLPRLCGGIFEHVDERVSDDRALLLRITFAGESIQEAVLGPYRDQLDPEVCAHRPFHLFPLVQSQ